MAIIIFILGSIYLWLTFKIDDYFEKDFSTWKLTTDNFKEGE